MPGDLLNPGAKNAMIDHRRFFDEVRGTLFAGSLSGSQVSGMEALLVAAPMTLGLTSLAYALATVYHETAKTMQPIEEYGHGRGRSYGTITGPWKQVYDGRGDVQLTWEANYKKATARLRALGIIGSDIDLERDPALALRPDLAADILFYGMVEGWFTGKKLSDYFYGKISNPTDARRIINGTDKASLIAGYHAQFVHALDAATISSNNVVVVKTTIPVVPPTMTTATAVAPIPAPSSGVSWWARFKAGFGSSQA
jgi:hypothetical protein